MPLPVDHLLAALEAFAAAAERDGRRMIVVGGVAARLQVVGEEVPLDWPLSVEALGTIRRSTNDVDVVLAGLEPPPTRRDELAPIDLLPGRSIDDAPVRSDSPYHPMSEAHTIPVRVGQRTVLVAGPALLVLSKAAAYASRRADRDLTDIASVAIRAAAARAPKSPEVVRAEIEDLLVRLPGAGADLRLVARRFRRPDDGGPTAFVSMIRAAVANVTDDQFEDDEDRLRDIVSTAVRRLLGPWLR